MAHLIFLSILYYLLISGLFINILFWYFFVHDHHVPNKPLITLSHGPEEIEIIDGELHHYFSCGKHLFTLVYSDNKPRYIDIYNPLWSHEVEVFNLSDLFDDVSILLQPHNKPLRLPVKEVKNCYTIVTHHKAFH